jgi:hypothetical protein
VSQVKIHYRTNNAIEFLEWFFCFFFLNKELNSNCNVCDFFFSCACSRRTFVIVRFWIVWNREVNAETWSKKRIEESESASTSNAAIATRAAAKESKIEERFLYEVIFFSLKTKDETTELFSINIEFTIYTCVEFCASQSKQNLFILLNFSWLTFVCEQNFVHEIIMKITKKIYLKKKHWVIARNTFEFDENKESYDII